MNYIDLLQRAARAIWDRKHLMVLGTLLVIITSGVRLQDVLIGPVVRPLLSLLEVPNVDRLPIPGNTWLIDWLVWVEAHGAAGWAGLVIGILSLGILLGVVVIVTRGALIASAGAPGTPLSLLDALKASWRQAWRLILIASIPPIPVTIAAILIVVLATVVIHLSGGVDALSSSADLQQQVGVGLLIASAVILLPFCVVTFALGLLSTLADRACVLEDANVIEAYRRGWGVLRANFGSAAMLALLHLAIESVLGAALVLPGLLAVLCLAFLPIVWIAHGIETAFIVTLWTLAWREWTLPLPDADPERVDASECNKYSHST